MYRTAILRISSSRAAQTLPTAAVASASAASASAGQPRLKFDDATAPSATLSPGLLEMVHAQLGPKAKPTHVQELCLHHFFPPPPTSAKGKQKAASHWLKADALGPTETLIAAETGSGKTMAYLLPLLHHLKATDRDFHPSPDVDLVQPRAIILAPTHELARQLAGAAKNLCHIDKLKVLCLSSGGWLDTLRVGVAQLSHAHGPQSESTLDTMEAEENGQGGATAGPTGRFLHPDIIVSTPSRLLSTLSNAREVNTIIDDAAAVAELRRNGRPSDRNARAAAAAARKKEDRQPLISLVNVRSVVIDEADVLLAPDFGPGTRAVLHLARKEQAAASPAEEDAESEEAAASSSSKLTLDDITAPHPNPKRSKHVESLVSDESSSSDSSSFPFDLILATATIPTSLASYLRNTHPNITTLASNRLHKLPSRLKADFVDPGGNKMAAIAGQIRKVLGETPSANEKGEGNGNPAPNKVLIFMNRSTSVDLLSKYLTENGISNVAVTSSAGTRSKKSNAHIKTFLRESKLSDQRHHTKSAAENEEASMKTEEEIEATYIEEEKPDEEVTLPSASSTSTPTATATSTSTPTSSSPASPPPRVLITTSLLSRGLDFDPSVTHVFLPDRISYSTSGFGSRRLAVSVPGTPTSSSSLDTAVASVAVAGINELELLHRAGRAARAGSSGKLVIFDKRAAVAASRSAGGASAGGNRKGMAMIRNKQGKYVPRAAEPLRKAVRGLLVPKKRTAGPGAWSPMPRTTTGGVSSSSARGGGPQGRRGEAFAPRTAGGDGSKGQRGDTSTSRTSGGSGGKTRPALHLSSSSSRSPSGRTPSFRR
ncbi:unnamed protein product [Tilletia controversa]|uniref:ATP-dependent RNA helicase n=3 Tax=Tilletia TaxID=13289 RepID=A0A8X7MNN0_9BASI|nr:hypothetical protein CF336_g6025 [Tilletia laevis]KAE8191811.1 hypothetical protein CF328_g5566 [Tilletia controversa]KAE8262765.1 hypothetical protein A4X03_0g2193 [Tilletia caries]KAE8194635.1 hypothetical protein CF335_g5296 [Tilletia laevis]KAE8243225.1 hypothetical protein A4X06_0g6464 [Tilletia controversa]